MADPIRFARAWPAMGRCTAAVSCAVALALAPGCSDSDESDTETCSELVAGSDLSTTLGGKLDRRLLVVLQACADMAMLAAELKTDLGRACWAMAKDLGGEPDWNGQGVPSDAQVQPACKLANDGIAQAMRDAGIATGTCQPPLGAWIREGRCETSFEAQARCDAQCAASGTCDPGTIEARCQNGKLSGGCSGECSGSCSATVEHPEITCGGTCSAICTGNCGGTCAGKVTGGCEGTCEGKCDGQVSSAQAAGSCKGVCEGTCSRPDTGATCDGRCVASCSGKCSGTCKGEGGVQGPCEGSCKGSCSVPMSAPTCEGTFGPPPCDVEADCETACAGSIVARARCTPPKSAWLVGGTCDAQFADKLKATFEVNMPVIVFTREVRAKPARVVCDYPSRHAMERALDAAAKGGGKPAACAAAARAAFSAACTSIGMILNDAHAIPAASAK